MPLLRIVGRDVEDLGGVVVAGAGVGISANNGDSGAASENKAAE